MWKELYKAFPEHQLARVPPTRWRDTLSPWNVRRRCYRRIIECRDGLVRISPRLDADNGVPLGDRIIAALDSPTAGGLTGNAVPVAIPASAGLDADAAELIRISAEIKQARSRTP